MVMMMMSVNEPRSLDEIEKSLALNIPFGDWRYIDNHTWTRYEHRLGMLAKRLSAAEQLLTAFRNATPESRYHVLGDTVVRTTINNALAALEMQVQDSLVEQDLAVIEGATRYLNGDRRISPTQEAVHQKLNHGSASHQPWVWCDERADDVWGQRFRAIFLREQASASVLRTPNEEVMNVLTRSVALLEDLMPILTRSALNHAFTVAVTDVPQRHNWSNDQRRFPYESFTTVISPGTLYLSMGVLRNPYKAAENLLHEALHLKLQDLHHSHAILRRGYRASHSPLIPALWNRPGKDRDNEWPACRSLSAMHVYVHLALYFSRLEQRLEQIQAVHGPLRGYEPTLLKRQAFERARYLGLSLRNTSWQELGMAGQRMVDWLLGILEHLGAGPAPEDDGAHLFLDLYESEARNFNKLLNSIDPHPENAAMERNQTIRQVVSDMLLNEIHIAERITSTLQHTGRNAVPPIDVVRNAATALQQTSDAELIRIFRDTRASIAHLLRTVQPDNFSRVQDPQTEKPLSALVRDMVMASGQQLGVLLKMGAVHENAPAAQPNG